jgi:hypothetical protein
MDAVFRKGISIAAAVALRKRLDIPALQDGCATGRNGVSFLPYFYQ